VIRGPSGVTVEEAKDLQENPPDYPTVFHGSPHSFEAFDIGKIGTGEGAQAYGHGLYFAERRGIAEDYKRQLGSPTADGEPLDLNNPEHQAAMWVQNWEANTTDKSFAATINFIKDALENTEEPLNKQERKLFQDSLKIVEEAQAGKRTLPRIDKEGGHLYQAKIMRPKEHFLDWDEPFSGQSDYVKEALRSLERWKPDDPLSGGEQSTMSLGERINLGIFQPHSTRLVRILGKLTVMLGSRGSSIAMLVRGLALV
jgi:hypothetical protein